ncbi:hypothetical protein AN619_28580 [Thermotalea metallivorans]|uniref:Uncharacterized protein n=1 Tax=Thermotalea metallivorans TaxID=520762 RepID=A0A140KZU9_9FIRM|nr:hypothetical protein AN619_28580 [Thermotalea metallivorans]
MKEKNYVVNRIFKDEGKTIQQLMEELIKEKLIYILNAS